MSYLKIITLLLAGLFSVTVLAQTDTNKPTLEQQETALKQLMTEINKKLPQQIDSQTTLMTLEYKDKVIIYNYKVDDRSVFENTDVKDIITTKTCSTAQTKGLMDDYGIAYRYNYVDKENKPLGSIEVNKSTCTE